MSKLFNLARMTSATAGTGTLTLGAAVSGYLTFALAGVADGTWVTYGIKDGSNSEIGYGKYTAAGTTLSRTAVLASTNGNALISCSGSEEVYITASAVDYNFPDNWLSGLTLSNDGVSPNTVLDIAAGVAADSTNTDILRLTSAITKTTGSWAVGTGNGGLDTGTIAVNTWYHVHLIRRPDTGVVDVLFSTSASAPTLPTNYTQFRRIGSFKTATGTTNILTFVQIADTFYWQTPVQDASSLAITTTPASVALTVPPGVSVQVLANIGALNTSGAGARVRVYSPLIGDNNNSNDSSIGAFGGGLTIVGGWAMLSGVYTNTSQQVRVVEPPGDAGGPTINIFTCGWIDTRGK